MIGLASSLVTLGCAYVMVSNKLAYIQGQLAQLMQIHGSWLKLRDKLVKMDKELAVTQNDVDEAHEKIRELKGLIAPTGGH